MGITYRQGNEGRLTVQQMDDNFHYLEDQLAGLTQSNSGSGTSGTSGTSGQNGATGSQGATGPAGQNGATGPAGQNGATGPAGQNGATGPAGATGPQGATGPAGEFNVTGGISFPFLPGNQRTGSGDNLQFEKGSVYQKIISTQDGTESAPTVERLVISGGDSYQNGPTYSGEGGDIYLWAGKGQNGGDIKVDAGEGISEGGTVKVRGGSTDTGDGGFVEIFSGASNNGDGGNVEITAGEGYGNGNVGGSVLITSGYGTNTGGDILLSASNGGTAGGNVIVETEGGVERMRITNDGKIGIGTTTPTVALDVDGDVNITGVITSTSSMILKPDSSLETDQYIILDPTEGGPNHIHIRAGGPIDDSATDLFIGGEDNNLKVSDTSKTVQINSKNLYTQAFADFSVGTDYGSATWSGNLITITTNGTLAFGNVVNFLNGYQAATDIFTVFYDPTTAVSLNITNKDISNYPTHVLTVDQTAPTASLAITGIDIEIIRYQSGRVTADNGTVTIQAGDTVAPKNWVFGTTGSITFPDNSVQTTAYTGTIPVETTYPTTDALKAGTRFWYKGNEWHYMTQAEIDSTEWTGLVNVGFPAPVRKIYDINIIYQEPANFEFLKTSTPDLYPIRVDFFGGEDFIVDFLGLGNPIRFKNYRDSSLNSYISGFINANLLSNLENIGTGSALYLNNGQLSDSAINNLFTQLPATTKTATIDVSNNPGSSTCNPTIATAKGYTVVI